MDVPSYFLDPHRVTDEYIEGITWKGYKKD